MHPNSRLLFEKYAKGYFQPNMRILEIGPDGFPSTYRSMVLDDSLVWDTLDLYQHQQLIFTAASEYTFPISDNTYDLVLSGQVIEHVRKIWVWMKEVARVCKVGETVITISPVSWPYHDAPINCWRTFPEGIRALYEGASLYVTLSKWESLEALRYRRHIPGRSLENQRPFEQTVYRILGRLGFPVECAFDCVTIGTKGTPAAKYEGTLRQSSLEAR
jgi:SAM-dependent methyltransferase